MLRAINMVHAVGQQQSLMYIDEHIYVYKRTLFYHKWYINAELRTIKLLKIRLYNRSRVANRRRLILMMVPGCLRTKYSRS